MRRSYEIQFSVIMVLTGLSGLIAYIMDNGCAKTWSALKDVQFNVFLSSGLIVFYSFNIVGIIMTRDFTKRRRMNYRKKYSELY